MALLSIQVPPSIARLFSQVDYGGYGKPESPEHSHITMVYFGDDVPIGRVTEAILATYEVTKKTRPFPVRARRVTTFPPNEKDGTVPIICRMDSPELHTLRAEIVKSYREADVEFNNDFPEYKPHVTLAYAAPGDGAEEVEGLDRIIPPIEWTVGEIVLWGGDEGDERLAVTFPLAWTPTKEAVYRTMVRLAQNFPR